MSVKKLLVRLMSSRKKFIWVRIVFYLLFIGSCAILAFSIKLVDQLHDRSDQYQNYFTILNSLQTDNREIDELKIDSLRKEISLITVEGWKEIALVLNVLKSTAEEQRIEMHYVIDTLESVIPGDTHYYRISIRTRAVPQEGSFKSMMQFFQQLSENPRFVILFDKIEMVAGDEGLSVVQATVNTWVQITNE